MPQTTAGFLDALANHLAGLAGISLTKGANLFAENMIDDPDRITDQIVIFDEGFEQIPGFRHTHVNWNVRFVTTRTGRLSAAEALQPITNAVVNDGRFSMTSDSNETFTVIQARMVSSPELTERLESGRFMASSVVQFQVIPD